MNALYGDHVCPSVIRVAAINRMSDFHEIQDGSSSQDVSGKRVVKNGRVTVMLYLRAK